MCVCVQNEGDCVEGECEWRVNVCVCRMGVIVYKVRCVQGEGSLCVE